MLLDRSSTGCEVSRSMAWRGCVRASGPAGPADWMRSNSEKSIWPSARCPARLGWAALYGMERPWRHGSPRSMRLIWVHDSASVYSGNWAFGFASHDPALRKQTRIVRRRIKKTPNADERRDRGSLGHRRSALPAAWFPLPNVDPAGDQGPGFATRSDAAQRRILWRCATAGCEISVLP